MKKRIGSALLFGAIGCLAPACFAGQDHTRLEITVRLYDYAEVPDKVLARTREIVNGLFEEAGIEVAWTACALRAEDRERYPDCRGPFGPRDLILRLLATVPAQFASQKRVFGVARMAKGAGFATVADIYYDRVEKVTWENLRSVATGIFGAQMPPQICTSLSLGMVVAHEMGHLLLGTNSHSRHGVMCAHWTRETLEQAYFGRQRFTPKQEERLQDDVRRRMKVEVSQGD